MSDYLPEEILIEILKKLQVKSLIRFMSVCKQWRCLIRSPSFISTHLSNTEDQALVWRIDIIKHRGHYTVIPKRGPFVINPDSELEIPFKSQIGWYFKIVGSSDGLVCLSDELYMQRIIIWNPATRIHVILPRSLVDPSEIHPFALGFGFGSNFYKVVRLLFSRKPRAEIFCLGGTGRWRKLTGFDHVRFRNLSSPIFLNGFVHWISCENGKRNSTLRFHVGDEVFGEIMLPHELEWVTQTTMVSLSMMGKKLGAFKSDGEVGNRACDVWMMKDYGVKESWTRLYRIDFRGFERVIGFWGSDEVLVALQGFELVAYNPGTKGIKHVGVFRNTRSFYVDDYKESLVLLGGYSGDSGEECES